MRCLGLIGARGGSKGIPRKNLVDLAGHPLIYYTFNEARKSKLLDRVVLSTDDPEIAALAKSCGVEVPFLRPAHLASDTAVLADAIQHALEWLQDHEGYAPDAILLLQPTSPLRQTRHIDEALTLFQNENADSVISLSSPQEHPWFIAFLVKLLQNDRATLKLLRTNPFPKVPPTFVRARLYRYRFSTSRERRETGNWWIRDLVSEYMPPVRIARDGSR